MPLKDLLDSVTKVCSKRLMESIQENRNEIAKTIAVAALRKPLRRLEHQMSIEQISSERKLIIIEYSWIECARWKVK